MSKRLQTSSNLRLFPENQPGYKFATWLSCDSSFWWALDPLISSLRTHYGWRFFKEGQRSVIEAVLSRKDALAVLPTGGGKSLCYQLPALIQGGLVVVISPLVALMEDQVRQLHSRGIEAVCLHAGLDAACLADALQSLQKDSLRLLYLAPERLNGNTFRTLLSRKANEKKIVAIAIDEAHCISAWGHDFRPDYRRLGDLRSLCPGVPLVALSATAAPKVRADIIRLLNLRNPFVHVASARRSNLHYSMKRRPKEALDEVVKSITGSRGAVLIYARTRRAVERWTKSLREVGIPALQYHAGLDSSARQHALNHFLGTPSPVLVATSAFGMGVDRADVGLVLHLDLPATPEGYLQQSGRAGRDGLPAKCVILFSPGDRVKLGWAMHAYCGRDDRASLVTPQEKERLESAQDQLRRMEAIAEGHLCREQSLLLSIGELVQPCGRCDRCKDSGSFRDWSEQALILLNALHSKNSLEIYNLIKTLPTLEVEKDETWGWLVRRLVQDGLIWESSDGAQRLSLKDSGIRFLAKPWPLNYAA